MVKSISKNEKSKRFVEDQLNKISADDESIKWLFWLICCAASSQKVENNRIKTLIDVKDKHFPKYKISAFNSNIEHTIDCYNDDGERETKTVTVFPDRTRHRPNLKEFIYDRSKFNRQKFYKYTELSGYDADYKWENLVSADGIGFQAVQVLFCASANMEGSGLKEHVIRFLEAFPKKEHEHWTQGVPELTAIIDRYLERDKEFEAKPYLLLEKETAYSNLHYNHAIIKVLGRNEQEKRLERFLRCDMPVAWFQLAGEGGQGKSRLAFDLAFKAKENKGWITEKAEDSAIWNAGFVVDESIQYLKQNIETWQPDRPTLLIFDYVIGQTEDVKLLLRTLSRRKDEFKENPIRILLLERQAWSGDKLFKVKVNSDELSGSLGINIGGEAAYWYTKLCDQNARNRKDSVLEKIRFNEGACQGVDVLGKLDRESIINIVRQVAVIECGRMPLKISDDDIFDTMVQIDKSRRPLFAYLLGMQLANDPEGYKHWTHIDILNKTLKREKTCRWEKGFDRPFPAYRDDDLSIQIAVLATIVRELDYDSEVVREHFGKLHSTNIKEAAIITSGKLIKENDDLPKIIKALEPDLLGEWFVLNAFDQGMEFNSLIDFAWENFESRTTEFLNRITRDFIVLPGKQCEHPDITTKILSQIFQQTNSEALFSAFKQHAIQYYQQKTPIPQFLTNTLSHAAEEYKDAPLMEFLGVLYVIANDLKDDIAKGIDWLEKSARAGNSKAMFNLGICYRNGYGVVLDWGKANDYFEQAADAGDSNAMIIVSFNYQNGDGVEKDWIKAISYLERAANTGNSDAIFGLGFCYQKGNGVALDTVKAVDYYEKAASLGNCDAMVALGTWYLTGDGVPQDSVKGIDYYEKAANSGDSKAMIALGDCYREGNGVAQDWDKAIDYYEKAACAGNSDAMVALGLCYRVGNGVAQDRGKAIDYYEKAANLGNSDASYALGTCYRYGIDVAQDLVKAIDYYEQAANSGDDEAMYNLGACYENGFGVAQDWAKAIDYFEQASGAGHESAVQERRNCMILQHFLLSEDMFPKSDAYLTLIDIDSDRSTTDFDRPLIAVNRWENLSLSQPTKTLRKINEQLKLYEDAAVPKGAVALRGRKMPLTFYSGYNLMELQLYVPGINELKIITAITCEKSALILNGESTLILLINPYLISLNTDNVIAYTCFYCAYVRSGEGPFHIVTSCDDVPFQKNADEKLIESLKETIFPPKLINDTLSEKGYLRVEACVLYGNTLFSVIFKVHKSGDVEMEDDDPIAEDLPIYQRQYQGVLRTQL